MNAIRDVMASSPASQRSHADPYRRRLLRLVQHGLLALSMVLAAPTAFALPIQADAPPQFADAAEERRFQHLVGELRCVMCQNQSLADSNAQIARDLRREVLELMRSGKSDREIQDFLVARYGEFVLYRPRVESRTWLLWFGPAVLLLAGGVLVLRIVRKRSATGPVGTDDGPTDDEQEW